MGAGWEVGLPGEDCKVESDGGDLVKEDCGSGGMVAEGWLVGDGELDGVGLWNCLGTATAG